MKGSTNRYAYALALLLSIILLSQPKNATAQVAIGDSVKTVHPSAVLELFSTDKGFLPPRMTTAQRDSLASPADGLIVYDTDLDRLLYYHNGWRHFSLWESDSTDNIFYSTGKVAIGPMSAADTMPAKLNISGTKGIVANINSDGVPAFEFIDSLTGSNPFNINYLVNTYRIGSATGATVGFFSYLEGGDSVNIGMGASGMYDGAGAADLSDIRDLPKVGGVYGGAEILDEEAILLAIGTVGISEMDQKGINLGVLAESGSDSAFAAIGILASANRGAEGILNRLIDSLSVSRFSAASLMYNDYNSNDDYNLFAFGNAKSYFGGNVGIGTYSPQAKLHVDGNFIAGDALITNLTVSDTFKIISGAQEGYILSSDSNGVASWREPLLHHKTVSISSSQILNISNSNPITLISAPGSGKAIIPLKVIFRYTFVTTAYSGAGTSAHRAEVRMNNGASGTQALFFKSLNSWNSTSSCTFEIPPVDGTSLNFSGSHQFIENDALVLTNGSGISPTSGDGTMEVEVLYMIIPY